MREIIDEHIEIIRKLKDEEEVIKQAVDMMTDCVRSGGKILFCGNGGSAADAQHLAAELSGKFYIDRDPINAEALHVNTSYLTAVGNDMGFEKVFSRALKGKGKKGDVLVALSTSGTSKNVIAACKTAKELGMHVFSLCGANESVMKPYSDLLIAVDSDDTPRIQEAHILIGHIFCSEIEKNLFQK